MSAIDFFRLRLIPSLLMAIPLILAASCAGRSASTEMAGQTAETIVAGEAADSMTFSDEDYEHAMSLVPKSLAMSLAEQVEGEMMSEDDGGRSEIFIPVVEPKKVEPRKAYIEPVIKVKIFGSASSITIKSEREMMLTFGSNFLKIKPDSRIQFKPRSARVSVSTYAVGIASFTTDEYENAKEVARQWKKEGYTVRLIKAGGSYVEADGTVMDTTVYWVALGIFKEKRSAEQLRDKMFARGISAWVIDESVLSPRGNIEVADAKGNPRAYADSRVTVSSKAPVTILNVPFGHGFWASGNREDRTFQSPVEIIFDKKGELAAVNEVKLEEYIKGIVPVEIRLTAHDEALKAQSVSARTEALAKLGIQHVFDPYDFCASQHCQEYGGLTRRTARTDAAVHATRGQVIIAKGSLIDAVYSANCGGHTENNEDIWSSKPNVSLRGASDLYSNPESFHFPLESFQLKDWLDRAPRAYCGDHRVGNAANFRWKERRTAKELNRIVNEHRRVGSVQDIKILRRGVSGRATKIRIVGSRDTAIVNKELQIRRVLGGLKSSMFIVSIERNSSGNPTAFTFHGGGWGHGVGMCQAGAEGMALRGFTYDEILKHYFSGAEIERLYE